MTTVPIADRELPDTLRRFLARRLVEVFSESPDVVPTTEGGVQLEWYRGGLEIEIRISPEGETETSIEVATPSEPTHD